IGAGLAPPLTTGSTTPPTVLPMQLPRRFRLSIIDFPAIIIDGAFPSDIRAAITKATAEKFTRLDRQGLSPLKIVEGTLGSTARALGGAAIPLLANFTRDREILFNEMV
ncbi:MAG: hypothetical protein ACTSUY_01645, partial [Alphaproteobacteria bacterium]